MAYDSIEPFGPQRDDFRSGIIASMIANTNRTKGGKTFKPSDFMPKFGKKKENTLVSQIKEAFNIGNSGKSG